MGEDAAEVGGGESLGRMLLKFGEELGRLLLKLGEERVGGGCC